MMPYNDTWKTHRRNITKITSTPTSLAVRTQSTQIHSAD